MHLTFAPPPVYFMHLPKTGGTTLGRWLRAGYQRGYVDLRAEQLDRLALEELKAFSCFHSWHLGRGLYELIGRSGIPCATMLRDPVERAASAVRHHQRTGLNHPERISPQHLEQLQPWLTANLSACVLAGIVDAPIRNAQTRVLGNQRTYAPLFHGAAQADARTLLFASYPVLDYPWLNQQVQEEDAGSFQHARAWLDTMAVVGLTERYAESVLLIADLLGIPAPAELPRVNVNPQRSDPAMCYRDQLAPEAAARLEELNHYDLELYAHATELFEQQWAHYQAQPRRTYSIAAHLRHALRPVKAQIKRVSHSRHVGLDGRQLT